MRSRGLSLRLAARLALPYGWDVGVPAVLGGVQVPFACAADDEAMTGTSTRVPPALRRTAYGRRCMRSMARRSARHDVLSSGTGLGRCWSPMANRSRCGRASGAS
jgi:hypothetical protein